MFKSAPTCFRSQRIHHQGALYSAWLKITRMMDNDTDKVGVMAAYSDQLYMCVSVCCYNIDLVHVNGHDRTILVILSQALYKAL